MEEMRSGIWWVLKEDQHFDSGVCFGVLGLGLSFGLMGLKVDLVPPWKEVVQSESSKFWKFRVLDREYRICLGSVVLD